MGQEPITQIPHLCALSYTLIGLVALVKQGHALMGFFPQAFHVFTSPGL